MARQMTNEQTLIPYDTLDTPDDLREWIEEHDCLDQAWDDHEKNIEKKWLVAAVDPDHGCFIPPSILIDGMYPSNSDGEFTQKDPYEEIRAWVLEVFEEHTGLKGVVREDVCIDLDSNDKITDVGGFAIWADDNDTVWLANFNWGDESDWLQFEYDELMSGMLGGLTIDDE